MGLSKYFVCFHLLYILSNGRQFMEVEFWTFFAILYIIYTDYIHIIYIYIYLDLLVLLFGAFFCLEQSHTTSTVLKTLPLKLIISLWSLCLPVFIFPPWDNVHHSGDKIVNSKKTKKKIQNLKNSHFDVHLSQLGIVLKRGFFFFFVFF